MDWVQPNQLAEKFLLVLLKHDPFLGLSISFSTSGQDIQQEQ